MQLTELYMTDLAYPPADDVARDLFLKMSYPIGTPLTRYMVILRAIMVVAAQHLEQLEVPVNSGLEQLALLWHDYLEIHGAGRAQFFEDVKEETVCCIPSLTSPCC
jgi:hypothetical protein